LIDKSTTENNLLDYYDIVNQSGRRIPIDKFMDMLSEMKNEEGVIVIMQKDEDGRFLNPERRLISKVCKGLNITRKKFKREIKHNPDFKKEVEYQFERVLSGKI
jgi:5S rRNA maturation endonuclease (ribonuclease M5)